MSKKMKMLSRETLPEATAFCCASEVTQGDAEIAMRKRALELLSDELYGTMPMGCSPKQAKRHVREAQSRVEAQIQKEAKDPRCGFAILTAISVIGFLWKLWELFSGWMWPDS